MRILLYLAAIGTIFMAATVTAATNSMKKGNENMEPARELAEIYFAGGCFWGVEEYFSRIPGVVDTEAGYANSNISNPGYKQVCSGSTNAAETVHVRYDPAQIGLDALTKQFFKIIDPLSHNRQGNDIGSQYRTGVYYVHENDKNVLENIFADEQKKYPQALAVELEPLKNFWPAETYHQDYLKKNPGGYCHTDFSSLADLQPKSAYVRPSDEELRKKLSPEEYHVVRESGTEAPFTGKYWNNHEDGIYVDVVSGQPLFSSAQKFDSGSGWPSFTQPLESSAIIARQDLSHGMNRMEVRSSMADSHLGHVFDDGPDGQPRYCINSTALRFIPLSRMDAEGYGKYKNLVGKSGK